MPKTYLMVRSVVSDAALRDKFDRWYSTEHLAWAIDVLKAEKGWRFWSKVDASVHVAVYQFAEGRDVEAALKSDGFKQLMDLLLECDYLPELEHAFAPTSYVATVDEWRARYRGWIQDPVRQEMYRARTLFDLRAIHGDRSLWTSVETAVAGDVDRDFVHVLANDCLASLPPLTFYEDAVIDRVGERHATFQLGHSALQPLVDVGRVFGIAG